MTLKRFLLVILCISALCISIAAAQPSEEILGDIRVQLLSDTLVRIEIKGPEGFEDRPSFTVVGRDAWEAVEHAVTESNGYTVISSSKYAVYIPKDATTLDGCYITDKNDSIVWQYSANTTSNVYLPSPSDILLCQAQDRIQHTFFLDG